MTNFPSAPSNDDEHTIGSRTWVYNSSKVAWLRKAIIELPAPAEPPPPPADPAPEPSIDSFSPNSTSISEGQTVTFTLKTSNVPDGTVFNLSLVGTSSSADYPAAIQIDEPVPSTITINSDTVYVSITFEDDGLSEGIETLIATISGNVTFTDGTNTITRALSETADTVSISDVDVPTYTISSPASINEGDTRTFVVNTTLVPNNTTLWFTVSPSEDLSPENGSFTINNNTASFDISATEDATTEGTEQGTVEIRTGSVTGTIVATDAFAINDTSTSPANYTVTAPDSIDEGSSGTINVTTTDVPNGTTLYWAVSPSTQFMTNSGSFSITNNSGSFTVVPTADSLTEGDENAVIRIGTSAGPTIPTQVASDTFIINDTSLTPPDPVSFDPRFDISDWNTVHAYANTIGFVEAWCYLGFTHDSTNERIIVTKAWGDSGAMAIPTKTYINYTGLTGITSVQARYRVQNQAASGDVNTGHMYAFGPTPVLDVQGPYQSNHFYQVPNTGSGRLTFGWMAQADPNDSASGNTSVVAQMDTFGRLPRMPEDWGELGYFDFQVQVTCDQGNFNSWAFSENGLIRLNAQVQGGRQIQ
jgi:hypothetical protein